MQQHGLLFLMILIILYKITNNGFFVKYNVVFEQIKEGVKEMLKFHKNDLFKYNTIFS